MIYLYVKQHAITGLKYFGKTKSSNPFQYHGSGQYWKNHFKKYGKKHIKTLEIYGFDDQELCTQFALKFSKDNNIVESKEWANLKEENGLDGGLDFHTLESKIKMSNSRKGKIAHNKGKIGKSTGPCSTSRRENIRNARLQTIKIQCEFCGAFRDPGNYKKDHGIKCKKNSSLQIQYNF